MSRIVPDPTSMSATALGTAGWLDPRARAVEAMHGEGPDALVGIDVGGTHTDVVLVDSAGVIRASSKVASTPHAPLEAIRAALAAVGKNGQPVGLCVNGTTIGINAVLQRRLPPIGLVATAGFGDLLYIRRETKENIYDLDWRKPAPLVSRDRVFEVEERIDAQGSIVRPIEQLDELLEWLERHQIVNVAVCLLHSYRNPQHEHRVRDAIRQQLPEVEVTLSSDVWPEWREFERTYNTALNAALKPIVVEYVRGLVDAVRETAGHERVLLMHADGGVLDPLEIAERPVLTLLSGTVAGALMGAAIAQQAGYQTAVSLDMGGTSTDLSLSERGQPRRSAELSIEWEGTLGFAGVDVVSIGSGGGSIAWIDEGGGLHVGPKSAGADPGPAAYGAGTAPTLTDAYLLLGYLGDEPRLAGRALSRDAAQAAFANLSESAGIEDEELWLGTVAIANADLRAGIRRVTIERGVNPRTCALVCFGGAGPLHAAALVHELDLAVAVVPPQPGNGSAAGLLLAPVKHGVSQTHYARLNELPTRDFQRDVRTLRERAIRAIDPAPSSSAPSILWTLSLRYRGQTRELQVPLPPGTDLEHLDETSRAGLAEAFHQQHQHEFTFQSPEEPIQLVSIRCEAVSARPLLPGGYNPRARSDLRTQAKNPQDTMAIFSGCDGRPDEHRTTVLRRESLQTGDSVSGPAIVLEDGSTTLIPPGARTCVDDHLNLLIRWTGEK